MDVPPLETERLVVREFVAADLPAVHTLLDAEIALEDALTRAERQEWLTWTMLSYRQLARLYQPPYGDRAIVLKVQDRLIGACGYVPVLNALGQIPAWRGGNPEHLGLTSAAVGLYYVVSPAYQRQGYATEAARALIDYAFTHLRLDRIMATTSFENTGSMAVMRSLGMQIEHNPRPTPLWLQVVGVLDHPRSTTET
jgi:ribosomal-protein-alanine N-acetyltransferase